MTKYDPRVREAGCLYLLKHGAILHHENWRGVERWWLSGGTNVRTEIARAVIKSKHVVSGGDALFPRPDLPIRGSRQ